MSVRGWRSYLDGQSLDWLCNGTMGSAAIGSLALALTVWVHPVWALITSLALSGAAWLCYWTFKTALERGLAANKWTDDARGAVKKRIGRITLGLLPLWFLILIVHFVRILGYHHGRATPMVWMPIWLFSQATTVIVRMINPHAAPAARVRLFADMKPIQSEHWGET